MGQTERISEVLARMTAIIPPHICRDCGQVKWGGRCPHYRRSRATRAAAILAHGTAAEVQALAEDVEA